MWNKPTTRQLVLEHELNHDQTIEIRLCVDIYWSTEEWGVESTCEVNHVLDVWCGDTDEVKMYVDLTPDLKQRVDEAVTTFVESYCPDPDDDVVDEDEDDQEERIRQTA